MLWTCEWRVRETSFLGVLVGDTRSVDCPSRLPEEVRAASFPRNTTSPKLRGKAFGHNYLSSHLVVVLFPWLSFILPTRIAPKPGCQNPKQTLSIGLTSTELDLGCSLFLGCRTSEDFDIDDFKNLRQQCSYWCLGSGAFLPWVAPTLHLFC